MKPFHPTRNQFRQMFRPKAPHPDSVKLKKLTSALLDLKAANDGETSVVHETQREGVFYQLHERQRSRKRLMGFREWCQKN